MTSLNVYSAFVSSTNNTTIVILLLNNYLYRNPLLLYLRININIYISNIYQ